MPNVIGVKSNSLLNDFIACRFYVGLENIFNILRPKLLPRPVLEPEFIASYTSVLSTVLLSQVLYPGEVEAFFIFFISGRKNSEETLKAGDPGPEILSQNL